MSRGRTRKRLGRALPVVVAAVGAGVATLRKRRAAGLSRREFPHAPMPARAPDPLTPASVDGGSAPPDSVPSLVGSKQPAASPAPAAARSPRGATTSNVLEALAKGGTMTAGDVASATGIGRATISSTLSRLTRTGAVTKADRGYQLPNAAPSSPPASKAPRAKPRPRKASSPKAPSKSTSARTNSRAQAAPTVADASPRTAPGATKAKILAALSSDGGLTAGEVATATGLVRGTVSTTLSKLAKTGEVVKADRGYRLPG
jgi:DNA-binding transcriptional ArsR family regulator